MTLPHDNIVYDKDAAMANSDWNDDRADKLVKRAYAISKEHGTRSQEAYAFVASVTSDELRDLGKMFLAQTLDSAWEDEHIKEVDAPALP